MERNLNYAHHRYYIVLILIVLSSNLYCQNTHIGSWKGTDKGMVGFISFNLQGYAVMVIEKDTIGGEEFIANGLKGKMTYLIDYNTNPKNIDIILTKIATKEEYRLLGIIDFTGDSEMKIRLNFNSSERPKDFLPEGNDETIILEKVK